MKRLSITLRVTLLYTLFMVLLAGLSLGFLFHAGAQSARQATLDRMQTMAEDSRRYLEVKDGQLDIDRDLEAFDDGVYLSLYDTGGGAPLRLCAPGFRQLGGVCRRRAAHGGKAAGGSGISTTSRSRWRTTARCGCAASRRPTRWKSTLGTLWRTALLVLPVFVVCWRRCAGICSPGGPLPRCGRSPRPPGRSARGMTFPAASA